jgi:hypothetical protein
MKSRCTVPALVFVSLFVVACGDDGGAGGGAGGGGTTGGEGGDAGAGGMATGTGTSTGTGTQTATGTGTETGTGTGTDTGAADCAMEATIDECIACCSLQESAAGAELETLFVDLCICRENAPCETDCAPECADPLLPASAACEACVDAVNNSNPPDDCLVDTATACLDSATCAPLFDCIEADCTQAM